MRRKTINLCFCTQRPCIHHKPEAKFLREFFIDFCVDYGCNSIEDINKNIDVIRLYSNPKVTGPLNGQG